MDINNIFKQTLNAILIRFIFIQQKKLKYFELNVILAAFT